MRLVEIVILCCKLAAYLLRMVLKNMLTLSPSSGGYRNLERGGSATCARSAPENFRVATPTSGYVNTFMKHVIIVATGLKLVVV